MYYFVVLVLDDINQGPDVLDAWEKAGVGGITIIESTGLARFRQGQVHRDDIPLMPSIRALFHTREEHHRTIFSISFPTRSGKLPIEQKKRPNRPLSKV